MSTEEKGLVEYQARDGQRIKLTPAVIKKYLVSGRAEFVTDQELYIYMGLCKSRGLNPFIKDCFLVKYTPNENAAIITSIDYYRKRARAQKDCKGWKTGIIVLTENGKLEYREGCIVLEGEKLIGGWAEGTPDGWSYPMRKEVNLKRYVKLTKEGKVTRFWSEENQPEMISKVAESQLLRALWPDEFQGLYVDSEMASHDAQQTFNQAVSTPSDPEPSPAFEVVFADEIKDPAWPGYLKASADTYQLTEEQVRDEFVKQPDQIKRLFVDWKKKSAMIAKAKARAEHARTTPATAPGSVATPASPIDPLKEKTFRDEWINLKEAGFSTFFWKNLKRFKEAPEAIRAEAAAKWKKFYPGNICPLVEQVPAKEPETHGEAQGSTISPEAIQGQGGEPEVSEREAIVRELNLIKRDFEPYIMQARRNKGYEASGPYPMSLDAIIELREEVCRLMSERPPK